MLQFTGRDLQRLNQSRMDWETHRTIGHASDFLGGAVFWRKEHMAVDAIDFLLDPDTKAASLVVKFAYFALDNLLRRIA